MYVRTSLVPCMQKIIVSIVSLFIVCEAVAQYSPKDVAFVGLEKSGPIPLGLFKAQQGVMGQHYISKGHWASSSVDSFKVTVFRDSLLLFSHQNRGNKFDPALVIKFQELKIKDRVLIYDIWASWPEMPKLFLQPLEYIIK